MKPSVTILNDIPEGLNRLATRSPADYEKVHHLIDLLREVEAASASLKGMVANVAGLRQSPPKHGIPLPVVQPHLERRLAVQYAFLRRTSAPRTIEEWKSATLPSLARLAQRVSQLFLSGWWANFHQCEVCPKWFLGRRQAKTCSAACREKKSESREAFKLQRRKWVLENQIIPRIQARLQKLQDPPNRLRREKWGNRLRDYRRELQEISRKGK